MTDKAFFVHERGICESSQIGQGTRIWAFAHVLAGATIGSNCNICDHVFIENDVVVGNDVTIKSGVQLWDGVRVGDRVFVGPNATFTNDRFPRSKQYPDTFLLTTVEEGASIGANATILPGITIGRQAMIGAGAVVTKNVPANAVVVGNPAVIVGYQTGPQVEPMVTQTMPGRVGDRLALDVGGCELWRLPHFGDLRGELAPLEFGSNLPFTPLRSFLVYGVPSDKVRGEHAHRECHQFLIAAHGRLSVVVDDGKNRKEVSLTEPSIGLYMPPGVWGIQYKFLADTTLLVMASHTYDASDYIRDYSQFLQTTQHNGRG
ncbi:WxcM-like domain-containing protein [Aminobacter anthyllidis]|uniref:WxcM-like domain-containing protein n=1 Tax=Aminobacter anthyllidis TaxID=1035067 RepID=A0A9X1AC03_9HYPH|nr:WxcM-like domain-containing protein [Aminobacter anthyllidis]MBT1157043.1 WxcM-like domain-containing protein [Aminobacter anthyllidis]